METLFNNQLPNLLDVELQLAKKLKVQPISPDDEIFDILINQEYSRLKWAITEQYELLVIPHEVNGVEISHTVIVKGKPVRAAGQVEIAGYRGNYFGIYLNNHSGHYVPDANSLDLGIEHFGHFGIQFDSSSVERIGDL